MSDPQTLNEFIMHIKGWEYIVALLFIASFIVFWQFSGRERD